MYGMYVCMYVQAKRDRKAAMEARRKGLAPPVVPEDAAKTVQKQWKAKKVGDETRMAQGYDPELAKSQGKEAALKEMRKTMSIKMGREGG